MRRGRCSVASSCQDTRGGPKARLNRDRVRHRARVTLWDDRAYIQEARTLAVARTREPGFDRAGVAVRGRFSRLDHSIAIIATASASRHDSRQRPPDHRSLISTLTTGTLSLVTYYLTVTRPSCLIPRILSDATLDVNKPLRANNKVSSDEDHTRRRLERIRTCGGFRCDLLHVVQPSEVIETSSRVKAHTVVVTIRRGRTVLRLNLDWSPRRGRY